MIRRLIKKIFAAVGLELKLLSKKNDSDVYERRGNTLVRFAGHRGITVLLDVGANEGQYAAGLRRVGFKQRTVSFEPVKSTYERLSLRAKNVENWVTKQYALGDKDGTSVIQIGGNPECSSLLPTNQLHVDAYPPAATCGSETIQVRALDSLRNEILTLSDRVFLKLDVQGFELNVLKGAMETLPQVELIDIELSLAPLYTNQPLITEILQFLDENGFVPVSLENAFIDGRTGHALQVDGIFVRNSPNFGA